MKITKFHFGILALSIVVSTGSAFAATCSTATVKGVYGILSSGLNGSGEPAASVDLITADGNGNITGTSTKSIDGSIVTFPFTGTYQISKDCTGTTSFTNQDDSVENDNIVLNNSNKGGFLIQTDSKHVQTSVAVEQGTAKCTNLGVKKTYSAELTGTVIGVGQVALGGQFKFNGKGSLAGSATLSLNGSITSDASVTGTYQINSDCTGSAQLVIQGLTTINLSLAVVNADKELMAVETDSNTIVAGTLLQ